MKKKSSHTSLPWKTTPLKNIVRASNNKVIATLVKGGRPEKELTANARFIVKAANYHDRLVDFLDSFLGAADIWTNEKLKTEAEQLLAEIEGEK